MRQAVVKVLPAGLIALGLCAPWAVGAGVDPALLAMVSPDSKMLFGIQVIQTQSSPLGQYLLSQLQLDRNTNQVMAAAGFDPRRDLREILAASGEGLNGLLLGRGSFQPAKISKAAVQAGAASTTYRGIGMLTLSGSGKRQQTGSIAFLDTSTVVAGDVDTVKATIDRHAAGSAAFLGPLADRARQISSTNDAWLASLAPPAALTSAAQGVGQLGPFQNLLQSALQLSAGVKFATTQVTLSAEIIARSAQDAQSMADVLRFFAGMLQSSGSGPNAPKTPSLADAAQISSTGSAMHLVISVPEQQMEQLLLPDSKQPPKKVAGR
jgi:hypothetical protein